MGRSNSQIKTVYQLYNSKNSLHNLFLKEMEGKDVFGRILNKYKHQINVVRVDVEDCKQ